MNRTSHCSMNIHPSLRSKFLSKLWRAGAAFGVALAIGAQTAPVNAGSFIFDSLTYPPGYDGNGGTLNVNVCLSPGVPSSTANAADRSLRNVMARWNRLQPSSANVRPSFLNSFNQADFESVAMHEMGHCIGLGHANIGGVVAGPGVNSTSSTVGSNNQYNTNAGADGVYGSADDIRGDDVNIAYFRRGINNPFSMPTTVDATTYSTDVAQLPSGELFPSNSERAVGPFYGVSLTEALMQHNITLGSVARTTTHDDVATIRYGMSGLDEAQNTSDDYRINLVYQGVSSNNCDITVDFDSSQTGFASCRVRASRPNGASYWTLSSGQIFFNEQINWFFNEPAPCRDSVSLTANEWKQISLPCDVGISSQATLAAVIGDDLGIGGHKQSWTVFRHDYTSNGNGGFTSGYSEMELSELMELGKGYWVITRNSGRTIDVQGEYSAQVDPQLFVNAGDGFGWNMVGSPFRFPTPWSDARIVAENGNLLSLSAADPGSNTVTQSACTQSGGPAGNCTVARFAYKYNGATESYDLLSPAGGNVNQFDGLWVFAARPEVELRLTMPAAERNTP